MKKVIAIILCLTIILSGCGYGDDVDNQAFVIAIGIDKGKSYPLRMTFVFANPSGINSDEEKSPASPSPDTVTLEAPTPFSAVRKLDAIKSKNINLTHTKIVVFSEEIAKKGIGDFLSGFASSRDFRPNTYVCISSGSAEKYLTSVKPSHENFIEKYYDNIMQKVASDKANEAYLYYLFFNVSNSSSGSLVPLSGVNENNLDEALAPFTDGDDFSYEARAGEMVRKAKNKAEILGSAILRNDKMIGTLGSFNTDLARIIRGEYSPHDYSISYPGKSDFVTVRLIQQSNPDISSKITNDNAVIDISVPVALEYIDAGKIGNSEKKSHEFCRFLEKELIHTAQNEYKSDFFGFGDKLKHHFPDMTAWEKFNWKEKFVSSQINISFKVVFADFEETN